MPSIARDRITTPIVVLASVLGVWLGLAGPEVSPVSPPMPAPIPVDRTVDPVDGVGHGRGGPQ